MFYAFYDMNRSEKVSTPSSMDWVLQSHHGRRLNRGHHRYDFLHHLKYRIVKTLSQVENEALAFATLIAVRRQLHGNDPP